MIIWVLLAAALILLLWPASQPAMPSLLASAKPVEPAKPKVPTYLQSVACLQDVRARLVHTGNYDEAAQHSIENLVLSLTAGSDK